MSLLVVGALHWDVLVRAPRLPRLDETLRGQEVAYQFGGKAGNQAMAAIRAGAKVAFAGRIGSDAAGAQMRAQLVAAHVDVSLLQQGPGASGMSVAIVTETGAYGAVIVSGENRAFDTSDVVMPPGCAIVLLQNEMGPDVLTAYAAAARECGARVIWNAAPAASVQSTELAQVDTLIVNRVEAADILGMDTVQTPMVAVSALSELMPRAEILLTLGGEGVAFAAPGHPATHERAKPVKVHSSHGAGDVFVGTFAARRLQGLSLAEAIAAGQKAAALHISQRR